MKFSEYQIKSLIKRHNNNNNYNNYFYYFLNKCSELNNEGKIR